MNLCLLLMLLNQVTGPVISGAGVIMSLAFAGMLATTNNFLSCVLVERQEE
jgi:hypothetical protein